MIPVIFLMGPTASGKTAMACALARRYPAEIINVDAAQVYRGLDIGTAKAGAEEREACRHHLIDIKDPDQAYSAAQFREDALRLIEEVRARGRLPLLTGGTMFYFDALLHGLPELPPSDPRLRAEIASRARQCGWPALHRELAERDPRRAAEISPNDRQRIQRALEVNVLTGRNVARRLGSNGALCLPGPRPLIKLALAPALRENLHRRIEVRFEQMLERGLVTEVAGLLKAYGGGTEPPSLKMVGYRQVADYLSGRLGYNRMMEASIAATRRLAKRQLTWLRRQSAVTWIDSDNRGAVDGVRTYLGAHPFMAVFPGLGEA
ncbi:MAG: tRNA (adenosine(37)-N6)-dimethylallyltransferase MiaA [Arenicellales bacterium]